MQKCQFQVIYDDRYLGETLFQCDEDSLPSGFCIFHDEDFKDYDKISSRLKEKQQGNLTKNDDLLFIGYTIPDFEILKAYHPRDLYLNESKILGESLHKIDVNNVHFTDAVFEKNMDFERCVFRNSDFSWARFKNVNFQEVEIRECDFIGTKFEDSDFIASYISNVTMDYAVFGGTTNFDYAKISHVQCQDTVFKEVHFSKARMRSIAFLGATFDSLSCYHAEADDITFVAAVIKNARFDGTDFKGELDFSYVGFPKYKKEMKEIPITFDYVTFRNRARFIGHPNDPLNLEAVSFRGTDLSNVEFHNVKWLKKEGILTSRNLIIDELLLDENKNYEEVSRTYNQLRKNYESKLLFTEASNFFIGELEAIRKSLWKRSKKYKMSSISYWIYKKLALYGESAILPLAIWTPIMIAAFTLVRFFLHTCSINFCNMGEQLTDSVAAYFQIPRSSNVFDICERIISAPILGSAFIAIRRKFERRK